MARRRKQEGQGVSLFPFLSILACVIGCLTLMITALALGQMDTSDVKKLESYEIAKVVMDQEQAKIEELKKKIAETSSQAGENQQLLVEKQQQLERLQQQLKELKQAKPKVVQVPQVDRKKLQQHLASLKTELNELQGKIKPLEAELAERKKPPAPSVVKVRPGGSGVDVEPTFVECAASSIVVYDGPKPWRVRRDDVPKDPKFAALLDRIAQREKATVIFLLRDDGLSTYYVARNTARAHYARNGKLPVIGHGKIDLSQFIR